MSFHQEVKYDKTDVYGSAEASDSFACIGAGTARGVNSETYAFNATSI